MICTSPGRTLEDTAKALRMVTSLARQGCSGTVNETLHKALLTVINNDLEREGERANVDISSSIKGTLEIRDKE